jgi:hypothetical protein
MKIDIVTYAKLLHRLANDEDFRSHLETDPKAALQEMQIELVAFSGPVELPTRARLQDEYSMLRKHLVLADNLSPFILYYPAYFD